MKSKKGFTLIEILAVMGLIAFISLVIIPSILSVSNSIKKRQLETKREALVSAAEVYAKNNSSKFKNFLENSYIIVIPVRTLLYYGYTNKDVENNVGVCTETIGCVINPTDNSSMNDELITIKKKKNVISASWPEEGTTYNDLTVNYNLNGADFIIYPSGSSNGCTTINNGSCTVVTPTIVRENFTVLGWGTKASAKSATLAQGAQLTLNSSNNKKTYYAVTKKIVTVLFDANGGAFSSGNTTTKTCTYYNKSSSCAITSMPTATRDGYELLEWNTNPDGTGTTITTSSTLSSDITVYAIWTPKTYILARRTRNYMDITNDEVHQHKGGELFNSGIADYDLYVYGDTGYDGLYFPTDIFEDGQRYIISFKLQKISGTFKKISGNIGSSTQNEFKINGVDSTLSFADSSTTTTNVTDNENIYSVYLDITYKATTKIYFQPNRGMLESLGLHITDLDIYQVLDSTSKVYATEFSSDNLATKTFGTRKVKNWYNSNVLNDDAFIISTANIFNKDTARFEDINTAGTRAYIFGDVNSTSGGSSSCGVYILVSNLNVTCNNNHYAGSTSWCQCDQIHHEVGCVDHVSDCFTAANLACGNRDGVKSYNSGCTITYR